MGSHNFESLLNRVMGYLGVTDNIDFYSIPKEALLNTILMAVAEELDIRDSRIADLKKRLDELDGVEGNKKLEFWDEEY
jgi:hypothetical protein